MNTKKTTCWITVICIMVFGLASFTFAASVEEMAKKEGKVIFYTSMDSKTANILGQNFQKKTGIKTEVFRSGTGKVLAKVEAEFAADKYMFDVVQVSDMAPFIIWARKGLLEKYKPEGFDKFFDFMKDPDGYWLAVKSNTSVIAYNTNKIKKSDAPKSWKDLLDPKFKDKISMSNPYYAGTTAVNIACILELYGWDYYRQLAKLNPHIDNSHGKLETLMISAERPLIAEQNNYSVLPDKFKGQPVEVVYPTEGVTLSPGPAGILKKALHPNAAKLLMDYICSIEAQEIIAAKYYYPGRVDVPAKGQPSLSELKFLFPKITWLIENKADMVDKFDTIMGRK
jgi:iron(III) transport system substrate-binding protein